MENTTVNNLTSTEKLTNTILYGLLIAIVFVSTYAIQIPMPFSQGGLVHAGDIALFTVALVFGYKKGAICGGVGMGLFDLFSAYSVWAPYTFIIRLLMGFVIGYIAHINNKKGKSALFNVLAVIASLPILIGGYYIAEALIYGNWVTPVKSIVGNLTQFGVGLVAAIPLTAALVGVKQLRKYQDK